MKQFWFVCIATLFVSLPTVSSVNAEEPYQQFIDALRSNGYHDYALLYLDSLAKKPGVPPKMKDAIDFERAETLIMQSGILSNPEKKKEKLKQAEMYLQKFLKEHPRHSYAWSAQMKQGTIYLNRARVFNYQLKSPANAKDRSAQGKLRTQSRAQIAKAKAIFEKARIHFERETKKYPAYIPPQEVDRVAARDVATSNYIFAQYYLGSCAYEEAQTHSGAEFRKRLMAAAKLFDAVHNKYRKLLGGLYAHMFQGKCYEEQGGKTDISRALGIYKALLGHPGDEPAFRDLQNRVLQFKLICLNHPTKKDYQLVIKEAEKWLASNRKITQESLGIQWEKAIAEEALGKARDLTTKEKKKFMRDAHDTAQKINRYGGAYKDLSTAMILRTKMALGLKDSKPKDFDSAYAQAEMMLSEVTDLQVALDKEKDKKVKAILQSNFESHLRETVKKLRVALSFVNPRTPPKVIHQIRKSLGHMLYYLKERYEAAVYAGYVADNARKIDNELALQASVLAYYTWIDAYYAVPKGANNEFEATMLKKALERTITHWADSKEAANAMMNLGRLYSGMDKPALAAEQFNRIPRSSSEYPAAQFEAGKSYLAAYAVAFKWKEEEHPDKKERMKFLEASAEKHFRRAVRIFEKKLSPQKPITPQLADSKRNLASILKYRSQFQQAIDVLTKDPHSVLKAIQVKNESSRPKVGVKSKAFAKNVYQMLLFSYIGVSQVKQATATLDALDKIGGKADTSYYVNLGRKIGKDIERLKEEGKTAELKKMRASLESFLDTLSAKKSGQTYQSLIWVAETYNGLGTGMKEDPQAAKVYFAKAAVAYKKIIDRAETEGDQFLDKQRVLLVRLRLVNCWREEGQYQNAFKMAQSLIKAAPKNLNAQQEMARLLQSWGTKKDPSKLLIAILGNMNDKKPGLIWGWGQVARILQQNLNRLSPKSDQAKGYKEKWIDAVYQSGICRFEYAKSIKENKKSKRQMELALSEIRSFISVTGYLENEDWDKFDELYQEIQQTSGISPVVALERPKVYPIPMTTPPPKSDNPESTSKKETQKTKSAKAPVEPVNWVWVIAGLGMAVVVALGLVMVMAKSSKQTYSRPVYEDDAPDLVAFAASREQAEQEREMTRKRASAAMKKRSSSTSSTRRRSSQSTKPRKKRSEKTTENSGAESTTKPKRRRPRPTEGTD